MRRFDSLPVKELSKWNVLTYYIKLIHFINILLSFMSVILIINCILHLGAKMKWCFMLKHATVWDIFIYFNYIRSFHLQSQGSLPWRQRDIHEGKSPVGRPAGGSPALINGAEQMSHSPTVASWGTGGRWWSWCDPVSYNKRFNDRI